MPIQFRCSECGQLLSVTRRKAGAEVTCPQCARRIRVPKLPNAEVTPEVEEQPEPESDHAEISRSGEIPAHSEAENHWEQRSNPWLEEDTDEDEDFQLQGAGLTESGLDMTPMVDVTFLLLIFFMITASFTMQKSQQASPPQPDQEGASQSVVLEELESESVVVEIDGEDNIRVDDVAVSSMDELLDVLLSKIAEGKTEMLIEADSNARHGTVVAVTDAGLEAQMQRIRRTVSGSSE